MNNEWAESGGFAGINRAPAILTRTQVGAWARRHKPTSASAVQAAALALLALAARAQAGEIAVTCTNPSSGASWRIAIDADRGTVDSYPARMTDTEISWRDAKDGWRYTLDRKTGKLTVVLASATGGNFLYDQCELAK